MALARGRERDYLQKADEAYRKAKECNGSCVEVYIQEYNDYKSLAEEQHKICEICEAKIARYDRINTRMGIFMGENL